MAESPIDFRALTFRLDVAVDAHITIVKLDQVVVVLHRARVSRVNPFRSSIVEPCRVVWQDTLHLALKKHLLFMTFAFDLSTVCSLCDVDLCFTFSLADFFVLTEIGSGCHKEADGAWRVVTLAASSLVDCR